MLVLWLPDLTIRTLCIGGQVPRFRILYRYSHKLRYRGFLDPRSSFARLKPIRYQFSPDWYSRSRASGRHIAIRGEICPGGIVAYLVKRLYGVLKMGTNNPRKGMTAEKLHSAIPEKSASNNFKRPIFLNRG